jgi:hypothetical protein
MYTLLETRTDAREILNETTASFFTDAELNIFAGDALVDISVRTQCNQDWRTDITTASRTVPEASSGLLLLETGDFLLMEDGSYISEESHPILKMSYLTYGLNGLRRMVEKQMGHIGKASSYPTIVPTRWWERSTAVGIEPMPTTAYTIQLYVATIPDQWTSDSSVAILPLPFQHLILPYVLIRAYLKDSQHFKAGRLYDLYIKDIKQLTEQYTQEVVESRESYKTPDLVVVQ